MRLWIAVICLFGGGCADLAVDCASFDTHQGCYDEDACGWLGDTKGCKRLCKDDASICKEAETCQPELVAGSPDDSGGEQISKADKVCMPSSSP